LFDMFKVISIGDEEIGSVLPQVQIYSRTDDIINIGSYLILSEREIWNAIDMTGLKYQDWTANKEIIDGTPVLRLYIELKEESDLSDEDVTNLLDKTFSNYYQEYCDLKEDLQINPLVFTRLAPGSFKAYEEFMVAAGVELEDIKPPHMRPSPENLKKLLTIKLD